jgi:hypothetical protein
MSKMGLHHPFAHPKHKLWSKERSKVKLTIWLPIIKSQKSTWFPSVKACATYRWKALEEGYNFSLDLIVIKGLHAKLWAPKVAGVSIMGISGLPNPEKKCHLDVAPMQRHKEYYKEVGGASPKFKSGWILWIQDCPWLILTPKVLKLCTNEHVVLVCEDLSEWISCLSFFLVPFRSSNTPLYP